MTMQRTHRKPRRAFHGLLHLRQPGTMVAVDFARTLHEARDGSADAIAALTNHFYESVRVTVHRDLAYDLRRSRKWLAAKFSTGDIVHEVFLGVLRDLGQFEGRTERDFEGWLARTCEHRLLDAIRFHEASRRDARRGGIDVDLFADQLDADATRPEHILARNEQDVAIREAIAQLPAREQDLLQRKFFERKTFAEIATELGYPSGDAARKAARAAEARLLMQLRRRGVDGIGPR